MGNCLAQGVGNYLIAPLGNCLTLEAFSLGNYLIADRYEGTSAKAERFFTGLTQLTKLDTSAGARQISATTTPRLV